MCSIRSWSGGLKPAPKPVACVADIVRVVFDTNGLVSAFLARGLCADLLRLVLTDHTLLTSEVVNPRRCWE